MATKKICDRCGKEIKYGEVSHFAGLSLFRYEGKLTHELCEECTSELREWLHGKERMEGERRDNGGTTMRLIEQLRWWATECDRTNFGCQARKLLLEAAEALEKAEPVKHGRWVDAREYCGDFMCSNCNALYGTNKFNYCPNCGAKMDGGSENGVQ